MNADDFFMGWAFMIAIGPIYALINAIIALPSAIFSLTGHKRAGFIAWILAMAAILAYGIFPIERREIDIQNLIRLLTFLTSFGFAPQGLAYLWTRERPPTNASPGCWRIGVRSRDPLHGSWLPFRRHARLSHSPNQRAARRNGRRLTL
jgi:hypothetical protein